VELKGKHISVLMDHSMISFSNITLWALNVDCKYVCNFFSLAVRKQDRGIIVAHKLQKYL
jgi:hypothetical protein